MTVASAVGRGSTFQVLLPVTADLREAKSPDITATEQKSGAEAVLVVEDQPSVRRFLADALRRYGYTVWEADNAKQALRCFDEHCSTIKVVVTDILMPGMDGPELVNELVARSPELGSVLISGYPGPTHASLEQNLERSIYLQKPFSAEALRNAVRQALHAAENRQGES